MTLDDVKKELENGVKNANERMIVTISGGEPTINSHFIDIVSYLMQCGIHVNLLTNAERFADEAFYQRFVDCARINAMHITTTFHSHREEVHEEQNQTKNSFDKSLTALKKLFTKGYPITIKHCITSRNYLESKEFVDWIDDQFHPSVNIELWGMDLCGLDVIDAKKLFVPFIEMRAYLESALDQYLAISPKNGRRLKVYNIPLCCVDPYYWKLFQTRQDHSGYDVYLDPSKKVDNFICDSVRKSKECADCYAKELCAGTYQSAFDYFGDSIVKKIVKYQ